MLFQYVDFSGILSLFGEFQKVETFTYLLQILIILYPPFIVFSIFSSHFIKRRAEYLLNRLFIKNGIAWGEWHLYDASSGSGSAIR